MGISGHILGPRKLRRLSRLTGLPLTRAFIRNHACAGIVVAEGECRHYAIDLMTFEYALIEDPVHWTSCPGPVWTKEEA